MRNKITVYGLLGKIYNENKDIPKKIEYDYIIWKYNNDVGDYYSERNQRFFGENFNEMEAKVFLQSEVEIIQDNKIEKIIKLNNVSNSSDLIALSQMQWENNNILERKIKEIIEVLNEKDR